MGGGGWASGYAVSAKFQGNTEAEILRRRRDANSHFSPLGRDLRLLKRRPGGRQHLRLLPALRAAFSTAAAIRRARSTVPALRILRELRVRSCPPRSLPQGGERGDPRGGKPHERAYAGNPRPRAAAELRFRRSSRPLGPPLLRPLLMWPPPAAAAAQLAPLPAAAAGRPAERGKSPSPPESGHLPALRFGWRPPGGRAGENSSLAGDPTGGAGASPQP